MDQRLLLVFIFAVSTVQCQNNVQNSNATIVKNETVNHVATKINETVPGPKLPSLCATCNCTDDTIDCEDRNLTDLFFGSQWPNSTFNLVSFQGNQLTFIKPFPTLHIKKLILRNNKIMNISHSAFKQLINLTELDLSDNYLTSENLQPPAFEGRFSPDAYEPLAKLRVLNLANNELHSLHQDLFEHMSALKVLNLSGNLFSKIDFSTSIAIDSIVELEELDLSYCGLKSLSDTHFYSSFRVLKKLNLSGNQFTAPPSALEEAKTLKSLYMDENPMQIISSTQSFPRMPNLTELSLCCMPHLTVIGAGAFSGLRALEHLRIQNCPKLEAVDGYALAAQTESEGPMWPPLKKLDLSDNALRYLPEHFVARWDWLEELDLMNNKWSCDCNNQYLIRMLLPQYGKKLMGDDVNSLTCTEPPEHRGKKLTSLSNRNIRCLDLNGAQPEKDAMVLVGVLIGVMLAIPVCLTIFILWRRGFFFFGPQGPADFSRAFYKRTANDDDF
ncbi:TLR4 interactor with leucine rich repeats-like [Osmia bicornis bicornis]|uniref:TLR4 interactor with leucine rich repeats-like n=1 Tax=Osmia bicornis bicornis TaxID=1437191 RepID=UPI0010F4742F|nr:TLR4 interactor with leucine rich repeats-like [Osmia bicornis bicornis]